MRPALLDKQDSAAYLACGVRKLEQYLAAGEIPRLHHGRKVVLRVSDLDAFLVRLAQRQEKGRGLGAYPV